MIEATIVNVRKTKTELLEGYKTVYEKLEEFDQFDPLYQVVCRELCRRGRLKRLGISETERLTP